MNRKDVIAGLRYRYEQEGLSGLADVCDKLRQLGHEVRDPEWLVCNRCGAEWGEPSLGSDKAGGGPVPIYCNECAVRARKWR